MCMCKFIGILIGICLFKCGLQIRAIYKSCGNKELSARCTLVAVIGLLMILCFGLI